MATKMVYGVLNFDRHTLNRSLFGPNYFSVFVLEILRKVAAAIIVTEAGGVLTSLSGDQLDFQNRNLVFRVVMTSLFIFWPFSFRILQF